MRLTALIAIVLGAVVIIWEIPFVGSKTGLWPVLMLLALGMMLLAIGQMRHGGNGDEIPSSGREPPHPPLP